MKTSNILIFSVLIFTASIFVCKASLQNEEKNTVPTEISISCPEEFSSLAQKWISDYSKESPETEISLFPSSDQNIHLEKPGQLAIADEEQAGRTQAWKMAIGRDIIVPVISASNPFFSSVYQNGVNRHNLIKLFQEPVQTWGSVLENNEANPVKLFIVQDEMLISGLHEYLGIKDFNQKIQVVDNYEQFIEIIAKDRFAIGFCNLSGIVEINTKKLNNGLIILPIDKNENGKLDNTENFYSDTESFQRAVWIGKYPEELVRDIYILSAVQPTESSEIEFIKWVLTSGQKTLGSYGLNGLVYSEVQSKLNRIETINTTIAPSSQAISTPKLILFILAVIILLSIIIGAFIGFGRKDQSEEGPQFAGTDQTFNEHTITAPGGLFYARSHTWAFMEKDGSVKTGIDDFLQHITGPVSRIEMKKPGDKLVKGELFLSLIQKGKQLNLYAPVSGTVLETNSAIRANSALINASPFYDGWVYRIEPSDWQQEIPLLSMAVKYKRWISEEFGRLRDFLAYTGQIHNTEPIHVVLQDGGMLKNNLLEEFGPEIWEDFQSRFLDLNK